MTSPESSRPAMRCVSTVALEEHLVQEDVIHCLVFISQSSKSRQCVKKSLVLFAVSFTCLLIPRAPWRMTLNYFTHGWNLRLSFAVDMTAVDCGAVLPSATFPLSSFQRTSVSILLVAQLSRTAMAVVPRSSSALLLFPEIRIWAGCSKILQLSQ